MSCDANAQFYVEGQCGRTCNSNRSVLRGNNRKIVAPGHPARPRWDATGMRLELLSKQGCLDKRRRIPSPKTVVTVYVLMIALHMFGWIFKKMEL